MHTLLFRIRTKENSHLTDDQIVAECMDKLMAKWPQVKGYQYERQDECIQILMWGDIETGPQEEL
jgi:hypothetical protein